MKKKALRKPLYQGHPYFTEENISVSSRDKVRKTFAAKIKSISLPKFLGGCSIDKINVRCHNNWNL